MTTILRTLALASLLFTLPIQVHASKMLMPGDVIKSHAKEEENCEKCHKKFDKAAQSKLCMDCHKDVGKDVAAKSKFHGLMEAGKECKECHAEHKGRDFKAAEIDKDKFDHKLTGFELKGGHKEGVKEERKGAKVKCDDCHKAGKKFREAPALCVGCHKKDDKHKGGLGDNCAKCHVDKGWKVVEFDHNKTHFKLLGKHIEVKCEKCHIDGKFKDTPKTCVACHKKDDQKAHRGKLGTDCAKCHSEKDWKTTKFDHGKTNFPLLGKHEEVKCDKCHIDKKYKDTPKLCNSCHKKEDDKIHKGKFGTKCETCHTERDWKEILFDHEKKTKFPLLGKHRAPLKCVSCHKGDLYKDKLQMTCVSCHKKDDDKIHKGNFGPKCESCHTERDWKEILFDHDQKTKFPLLGKHRAPLKCVECHKGDLYKDKLQMTCVSCHKKDDDKIHKGKFGAKCETCHTEKGWKDVIPFDHDKKTKFPLLGKHQPPVKCVACHKGDLYQDKLQTDCFSCHEKDDKHKTQEGKKCETCHTEESWTKTKFNHQRMSVFPLLGRHVLVACKKCHLAPTFKDAGKDCFACHEKDDTHKRKLGTECQTCHSTRSWETWDFDHNKTNFKLDGPHKKSANKCYSCHSKPMDKKVLQSTSCGSCHDRDDVHNGNFGERCDRCHDGNTWKQVKMGVTSSDKESESKKKQ